MGVRLGARGFGFHHVLHHFLGLFVVIELADALGGDVHGVEPKDFPTADLDVEAEPVGAVHAAGSKKGHRGCDLAFIVVSGAVEQVLSQFVGPGGSRRPAVRSGWSATSGTASEI